MADTVPTIASKTYTGADADALDTAFNTGLATLVTLTAFALLYVDAFFDSTSGTELYVKTITYQYLGAAS